MQVIRKIQAWAVGKIIDSSAFSNALENALYLQDTMPNEFYTLSDRVDEINDELKMLSGKSYEVGLEDDMGTYANEYDHE